MAHQRAQARTSKPPDALAIRLPPHMQARCFACRPAALYEKIKKRVWGVGCGASAGERCMPGMSAAAAVGIDHRAAVFQSKPSTSRQKRMLAKPWVKFVFIAPLLCPHRCMHACMHAHRHSPLPTISLACGHSPALWTCPRQGWRSICMRTRCSSESDPGCR